MIRKITAELNEQLFAMWIGGMSLWDIFQYHKSKDFAFSYRSLLRAKERYNWEERRSAILEEYRRRNDEDILIEKRKAQLCISMLFDMINEMLMLDYRKYLADPEGFAQNIKNSPNPPFWLVTSLMEFRELLSCQNIILNGAQKY